MGRPRRSTIEDSSRGIAGLAGLVVVALAAGAWFGLRGPAPVPPIASVAPDASSSAPATITVHVSGAVAAPGLVEVRGDARVADALAEAGGAAPDAELSGLNLAAPLRDGEQIQVPGRGETAAEPSGVSTSPEGVRINIAPIVELQRLPGVGPVLAARIAEHRDVHGPFEEAEDLLDVSGIGEAKLAAMRDALLLP